MDAYRVLINPRLAEAKVLALLTSFPAVQLGCFSEEAGHFSAWEFTDNNGLPGECELHWQEQFQFGYMDVRTADGHEFDVWLKNSIQLVSAESVIADLTSRDINIQRRALAMVELEPREYYLEHLLALRQASDPQVVYEAERLLQLQGGFSPEPDSVIQLPPNKNDKRQLLRWILASHDAANAQIKQVLSLALVDEDWEVRTSAQIAVARYKCKDLARLVAQCSLPAITVITKRDREILDAIQKLTLLILSEQRVDLKQNPGVKQARWQRIYNYLNGGEAREASLDIIDLFFHYFTTPFSGLNEPPSESSALIQKAGCYFLLGVSPPLEMQWVPAGSCWCGATDSEVSSLQIEQICKGFFISKYHFSEDQENSLALSPKDVTERLQTLSLAAGVQLQLPDAVQWQMAMRANDGRPYAWGWGQQADWIMQLSPWGLSQSWSDEGEWVRANNHLAIAGKVNCTLGAIDVKPEIDAYANNIQRPWRVVFAPEQE